MVSIFIVDLGIVSTSVALPLLLVEKYGVSLAAGVTFAIRLLPSILAGPVVGGVLAARDPRQVAVTSTLCSGVFAGLIPVSQALWQVQVLSLGMGIAAMFALPAWLVLRPAVIAEGEERRGNGLLVAAQRVPTLLGPPLVGLFVIAGNLSVVFLMEAVTAALAAVMIFRIPPLPSDTSPVDDARSGQGLHKLLHQYARNTRALLRVTTEDLFMRGATITSFTYSLAVALGRMMLLVLGAESFSQVSGFYGWMLAAMGVGGLCGSLFAGHLRRVRTGTLYIVVMVVEALIWLTLPWLTNFLVALALMAMAGIMESTGYVLYYAEAQLRVPASLTGYYYAALIPVVDACTFVGTALGAFLAGWSTHAAAIILSVVMGVPILATARWYYAPRMTSGDKLSAAGTEKP
ncbi:MFS transporter [Streptomyces sp. MB09-02B]|uniref:MFS transporter n=1 Tax=Streptomyces sp. MB09-02B TaxID=3028667 RepID=UPI0029AE4D0B|nr:MFS transporter [Streptomyces sp. MB09-02B]MDX3638423.1 MFS transporter [Streptomyces sp. MB09-02B]